MLLAAGFEHILHRPFGQTISGIRLDKTIFADRFSRSQPFVQTLAGDIDDGINVLIVDKFDNLFGKLNGACEPWEIVAS